MPKNRILEEMLKKANKAANSTIGMYPKTVATNVFLSEGSSIEIKDIEPVKPENPTTPLPEEEVKPADTEVIAEVLAENIASAEDNTVISITGGEVAQDIVVDKGVTLQGVNAGIAQNFDQEV